MTLRSAILTILLAVATSAATTSGIMYYQAGRVMDRLSEIPLPECDVDCQDEEWWLDGGEHRRVLDALQTMTDETLGREI